MFTEEQKAALDQALERTGGNRAEAAEILGIAECDITAELRNCRVLRKKWSKSDKTAPEPGELLTRVEPSGVVTGGHMLDDAAVEQSMADGLTAMGINKGGVQLAISFKNFTAQHFTRCMQIMGGGLTRRFMKIENAIDEIDDELATLDVSEPAGAIREQTLRQDRSTLIELQQKAFDRVNKAALTQATIAQKAQAVMKGSAPSGKPGFAPKRVQVVELKP